MGSSESRLDPVSLCPCPSLSGPVNHGSFPRKPGEKGVTGLPCDSHTHPALLSPQSRLLPVVYAGGKGGSGSLQAKELNLLFSSTLGEGLRPLTSG